MIKLKVFGGYPADREWAFNEWMKPTYNIHNIIGRDNVLYIFYTETESDPI